MYSRLLCFLLLAWSLFACEKTEDYYINMENHSDKVLKIGFSDSYPKDSLYFRWEEYRLVEPYSERRFTWGSGKLTTWYAYFNTSTKEHDGFLSVTIIDAENNNAIMWGLQDYAKVLARYDFTREDMERLGWRISYPPDDSMPGVHMYLPK